MPDDLVLVTVGMAGYISHAGHKITSVVGEKHQEKHLQARKLSPWLISIQQLPPSVANGLCKK